PAPTRSATIRPTPAAQRARARRRPHDSPYDAPTATALSVGAGPAWPCAGTMRISSDALSAAPIAVKAGNVLGSGTAKVVSIVMCMPGIIGPKNATVPAWYGLPGSARVVPGGALTSTSNARVVDSPPGRGSVIAATS